MKDHSIRKYCPNCGIRLQTLRRTNYQKKVYVFHCTKCNKFYRIQYVLVEYKGFNLEDKNEN